MPLLKRRYEYTKVWRPHGTPYATVSKRLLDGPNGLINQANMVVVGIAVENAIGEFQKEFSRNINRDRMVIEALTTTTDVVVTVYELPEEGGRRG